jgi:DNA-binding GntR family transcriptional regulator
MESPSGDARELAGTGLSVGAPRPRTRRRLVDRIEADVVRREPGAQIPAADDLAALFGVSPGAIRRALTELERRFVVRRADPGHLVVASRIDYRIGSGMPAGLTEAIGSAGATVRSETERIRLQRVPPRVRVELDVPRTRRVYVLSRRRFLGDEAVACSVSYVVADLAPGLPERLGHDGSLHATLRDAYGLEPVPAWVRAEMDIPPPDIPRRLKLHGRPMMVSLRARTDCARLQRSIELTASWLRPDVFRVLLEVEGGSRGSANGDQRGGR